MNLISWASAYGVTVWAKVYFTHTGKNKINSTPFGKSPREVFVVKLKPVL